MQELQAAAQAGSPTAKALLNQIEVETTASVNKLQLEVFRQQQAETATRVAAIEFVRLKTEELLAKYAELKTQVEEVIVEMAQLDLTLPFSCSNRSFPQHLRKCHMPSAKLGRHETAESTFTSVEAKLMSHKL